MRSALLILAVVLLGIDAASKYWVDQTLPVMSSAFSEYPYGGIGIFKNFLGIEFSITHLTNRGAAWGTLGDYQLPLQIFRIFLIAVLIIYVTKFNKAQYNRLALCLIITGAIGNVIDYFVYGHVVDMLHFVLWGYDFPVFNVADSAVTIGIGMLVVASLCQKQNLQASA